VSSIVVQKKDNEAIIDGPAEQKTQQPPRREDGEEEVEVHMRG
jgi:hypothetical protein